MPAILSRAPTAGRLGRSSRFLLQLEALDGLDELGRIVARTGHVFTFGRGGTVGAATTVDANGVIHRVASQQPRFYHSYDAATGLWLPRGLLLEGLRVNLCQQSESWGTSPWVLNGAPTKGTAHTASGVVLDLLIDDDATSAEGYYQTITFTGDGVKALSLFVKAGTTTTSQIRVRDDTAAAERLIGELTWSGGLPSMAMATGTYFGYLRYADGVFRLLFQTSSITAANAHRFFFYIAADAARTAALTGNIYAGGVQAENATFPSSYIPTTSAAVTRSADSLSCALNVLPRAMTVYADVEHRGTLLAGSTERLWAISNATAPRLSVFSSGGFFTTNHVTGGGVGSTMSVAPAMGQRAEVVSVIYDDGSVQTSQSIDSGTVVAAARSAAEPLGGAWAVPVLFLNERAGGTVGFGVFRSFRIAVGPQTPAYMRAA